MKYKKLKISASLRTIEIKSLGLIHGFNTEFKFEARKMKRKPWRIGKVLKH